MLSLLKKDMLLPRGLRQEPLSVLSSSRMVSSLEQIPGQLVGISWQTRIVRSFITWPPIFIVLVLGLQLIVTRPLPPSLASWSSTDSTLGGRSGSWLPIGWSSRCCSGTRDTLGPISSWVGLMLLDHIFTKSQLTGPPVRFPTAPWAPVPSRPCPCWRPGGSRT